MLPGLTQRLPGLLSAATTQASVASALTSTWDPTSASGAVTLSQTQRLACVPTYGGGSSIRGTKAAAAGKLYLEIVTASATNMGAGIVPSTYAPPNTIGQNGSASGLAAYIGSSTIYLNGGTVANALATVPGAGTHVLGFAIDLNNGLAYLSVDGAYKAGTDPVAGTGGISIPTGPAYLPAICNNNANSYATGILNTGNKAFDGALPAGFQAWG